MERNTNDVKCCRCGKYFRPWFQWKKASWHEDGGYRIENDSNCEECEIAMKMEEEYGRA